MRPAIASPAGLLLGVILAGWTALAASPDLQLAVGLKISNSIAFFSLKGEPIASVPVGTRPHEVVLSPDGKNLYVADNGMLWMTDKGPGGNTISIVDLLHHRKIGVIDLGEHRRPHGLGVLPRTGNLVVTVENPDGLLLVDPKARTVLRTFDTRGTSPHMLTVGADGEYVYVSNARSGNVSAVHLATGKVTLIPTGARPQGGVISADGRTFYVTNSDENSISIIDLESKKVVGTIATGKGPGRVVLSPDGKQLFYNLEPDQAVGFADVAARRQTSVVRLPGPPLSLVPSRDGKRIYSGIQSQDTVVVLSVDDHRIVGSFKTPHESGPDAVLEVPLH